MYFLPVFSVDFLLLADVSIPCRLQLRHIKHQHDPLSSVLQYEKKNNILFLLLHALLLICKRLRFRTVIITIKQSIPVGMGFFWPCLNTGAIILGINTGLAPVPFCKIYRQKYILYCYNQNISDFYFITKITTLSHNTHISYFENLFFYNISSYIKYHIQKFLMGLL